MFSVHHIIESILQAQKNIMLATVIHVDGSAYRKEGTCMLFLKNGEQIGTISAGCLEKDLSLRAKEMFINKEQTSSLFTYDMRAEDDLSWGRGAGCNGKIHVLLERLTPSLLNIYQRIQQNLEKRTSVKVIKYMNDDFSTIETICVQADELPPPICAHLNDQQDHLYIPGRHVNDTNIFIQTFHPRKRLFIFGAGPDVHPLANFANAINYSVHIWDWREDFLNECKKPFIQLSTEIHVQDYILSNTYTPEDAVIIMTHDFQMDQHILSHIESFASAHYIGILGPRERTKRLLQNDTIPSILHSPVGKDIGAEGPAEIAVSILSDMIDALRTKAVQPQKSQQQTKRTNPF